MKNITFGVPQGSILGPLMFLIKVNDLQKASSLLKLTMFADDTIVFYSHMLMLNKLSEMSGLKEN